jgi:hypothetical protein
MPEASNTLGSKLVAYFSMDALYVRYLRIATPTESLDSRQLLFSKTESKYRYLDTRRGNAIPAIYL